MFGEEFYTITIGEVIGTLIAVAGVWLVLRQLNESRLASQMEGIMTLMHQYQELNIERTTLVNLGQTTKWKDLSSEDAFAFLFNDEELLSSYIKIGNLYDIVGGLIRFKVLDEPMGKRYFGNMALREFAALKKVIVVDREKGPGGPGVFSDWEWLATEMAKDNKAN